MKIILPDEQVLPPSGWFLPSVVQLSLCTDMTYSVINYDLNVLYRLIFLNRTEYSASIKLNYAENNSANMMGPRYHKNDVFCNADDTFINYKDNYRNQLTMTTQCSEVLKCTTLLPELDSDSAKVHYILRNCMLRTHCSLYTCNL